MPSINTLKPYTTPDQSVQRGRLLKLARAIFLGCWGLIAFYITNAISNLFQALYYSQIPDKRGLFIDIINVMFRPGAMSSFDPPSWIFTPLAILCWPIAIGCIWATLDFRSEQKEKQEQDIRHSVMHEVTTQLTAAPARGDTVTLPLVDIGGQLTRPLGAPLDMARLNLQVPAMVRQSDLEWLLQSLRKGKGRTTFMYGLTGMGKTTLVSAAIPRLRAEGRFRDGTVVYDCKGEADATVILQKILARFDPLRQEPDSKGLEDTAHVLLDGKDALVVLLNVEPGLPIKEIVLPLCVTNITVLLTARQMLTQTLMHKEVSHQLRELSLSEAVSLFVQTLGREAQTLTREEREAVEEIVRILGYYPLAVKMLAAYSVFGDLETIARDLRKHPHRSLQLPDGETPEAVALAFDECTKGLPDHTKRLFAGLAAFPTIEFSRHAAIALAESLHIPDADAHIYLLLRRLLIEPYANKRIPVEGDRERLRIHPLIHAFASREFQKWTPDEREAARLAIANYYADYTTRVFESMPDFVLNADEYNIIGSLEWAHEQGESELEVTIIAGLQHFFFNRRRITAGLVLPQGLETANTIATMTNKSEHFMRAANLALVHGRILLQEGKIKDAVTLFEENLQMRRTLVDHSGESMVLACLGQVAHHRGYLTEADKYYQESMKIVLAQRDQQTEAVVLGYQGDLAWQLGRPEAEKYYLDSLEILRYPQNGQQKRDKTQALIRLGALMQEYSRHEEAHRYYQEARVLASEIQDRYSEGWLFGYLGKLARSRGKVREAADYYSEALTIAGEMRDRQNESWILGLQGEFAQARGRLGEAENFYNKALTIAQETQDRQREGWVLGLQGCLALASKKPADAERYYREALKIAREVDHVNYARMALAFGSFLIQERHNRHEGCPLLLEAEELFTQAGLPEAKIAQKLVKKLKCA